MEISYTRRALKDIKALNEPILSRIKDTIEQLPATEGSAKKDTPLPDEVAAIGEYGRDKANGTLTLYPAEKAWGK